MYDMYTSVVFLFIQNLRFKPCKTKLSPT